MKFIDLNMAPLSIKDAKAKHILTIKNPRFWLEGILQFVGIVISVVFLLPWLIESNSLGQSLESFSIAVIIVALIFWALYTIIFWIKLFKSFDPLDVHELDEVTIFAKEDPVIKRYVQKALAQRDYLYLAEYRAIKDWGNKNLLKEVKKEQEAQRKREQKRKKLYYAQLKDEDL